MRIWPWPVGLELHLSIPGSKFPVPFLHSLTPTPGGFPSTGSLFHFPCVTLALSCYLTGSAFIPISTLLVCSLSTAFSQLPLIAQLSMMVPKLFVGTFVANLICLICLWKICSTTMGISHYCLKSILHADYVADCIEIEPPSRQ